MSSLLFAELAATCNALGYFDGNKYYIDTYCQETVKDLIRYLRRDDENHEIRRYLGEAKILQADLLPILKDYWEKQEMFDIILRLLVNLTNPALLLYREELPAEKTSRNYYLQIITHLQSYKEAFCEDTVWAIFSKKLGEILQIDSMEREEDKGLVIERILILVRNVLQVPADPEAEKRTDNDASVHDQLLWALHQSGMVDIFLYIASSENEQQYYMHILEIVSLMLREQNPTQLASAAITRSVQEKERDEVELLAIRQEENRRRQDNVMKFKGARHSRFGGTYVLKDMKSISDKDLIYHKPLNKLDSLDFDHDKAKLKRPKNRLPMKGDGSERRSAFSIRLFLKEFCVEFLNGAYNTLMYHVKDGLVRAKAQANDESYYLWAMKFFMEFNRNYKFQVKFVSETVSVQTFHFVQTQLENFYDMITSDKKKMFLWSRRMHLALKAYQELLMTLMAMDKSEDETIRESSKVMKSNIFYVVEYRELILTLMLNFDEIKFTKIYLKDLIETAHIFLKLLEQFCSKRNIVVQKRGASKKRKTKKSNARKTQNEVPTRSPEEQWDEEGPQLTVVLQNEVNIPNVVPFDAASERDIDEQKADAMRRIQTLLRTHEFEEAVGLLRASREVWPENDIFGSSNMTMEEEFLSLKEIFMADIQNPENIQPTNNEQNEQNNEEEDDEEDEEEEGHVADISVREQDFEFAEFARRFVHHKVVQNCSLLLRQFDKNLLYTNHCIVKMLHRIAWDCKLPAILFQASLFHTFQRILDSKFEYHKEMVKFALFVVRKFVEIAKTNGKVYMELLFWKTTRDAFDIEQGYGSYQEKTHSAKQVWSEEEEEEVRRLYEEFTSRRDGEGENVGGNVVDWIMQNLINNSNRSNRGVAKKLRELGYVVETKSGRKSENPRPPKEWAEDEEQQLRDLFEEFREAMDPLGCIIERLRIRRPKARIVEKLLELGVVQDKKELRKKRAKKSRGDRFPDASDEENSADETDLDNEELDSDGGPPFQSSTPRATQPQRQHQSNRKTPASRKNKKVVKTYSSAEVTKHLADVIATGMSEALRWISSLLEETADDMETDGDDESVPILPLSEEAITAMDNAQFLNMLKSLGIMPPSDEQEAYWRIPATLSSDDLRKRVDVINQALDGQLVSQETDVPMEADDERDETVLNPSSVNDVDETEDQPLDETTTDKPSSDEDTQKNKSKHKFKRTVLMDSDSETEDVSLMSLALKDSIEATETQHSNILNSDSEEEIQQNAGKSKRLLSDSGTDEEVQIRKKKKSKSSSVDGVKPDSNPVILSANTSDVKRKRLRILVSDDEDD